MTKYKRTLAPKYKKDHLMQQCDHIPLPWPSILTTITLPSPVITETLSGTSQGNSYLVQRQDCTLLQ